MNEFQKRIFVAGHRGMVGSAIVRCLKNQGYDNIISRSHAELDLTDQAQVRTFFAEQKPQEVYVAAAKVGGIHANNTYPAEFIYSNLMVEANLIHESWRTGVSKLLFLGSSCIYPRLAAQPMAEDALLTGKLEPTNEPYAIAKIAGIKLCESYNRQYGCDFRSVMPTNLYGPGDNFDPALSHVLPALMRKVVKAKRKGDRQLVIWGTGTPRREFLYSDDLADACIHLLNLPDGTYDQIAQQAEAPLINIGTGEDLTIRELAELIARVLEFDCEIVCDTSRPDGTPQKLLDVSRMHALGWRAKTSLAEGIRLTYEAAREQLER